VSSERPHGASANGAEIVLLRTRDGVRGYAGHCPHQGALLSEGTLEAGVLVCRNHGWRFDAATGRRLDGPGSLQACPVREEDGAIWADVPARAPSAAGEGRRRVEDLPGPRGLPLLGNALEIDLGRLHARLEEWAATHGGIYQLRLGPRRVIVVSERTVADQALRARPHTFRRLHTFESVAQELGMVGVFTAEGDAWRPLRKLAMEALSNRRLPGFYPILRTTAERIRHRWARAAAGGLAVDIAEEFRRFTVDITTWLALGRDVNTVEGKGDVLERHLGLIFPVFHRRVVALIPYWRLFRLPSDRRFDDAMSSVRAWIEEVVAEARARLEADPARALAPANFLEAMICERDDSGRPFTPEALFGSVMTMLVAGQDTTAAALAWTVHHLTLHPEAMDRVRAEADAVLGDAVVPDSVAAAQRLAYAGAAVDEALRLSPIVPLIYLETNEDATVGDVAVPAGTPVILLTRPALRQGRFGAAGEFRPERWLEEERGALAHDATAHIPFGSGPRLCPGRSLAGLEARVALATLFKSFDVERAGGDVTERYTSIMVPAGLSAHLRAR
jgi:cytochrome P450/nitrite reductase/ring-hydroxylating ferredoxin subunit